MRILLASITALFLGSNALAASISPDTSFPWMNAREAGATYNMADYPNGVFVFEAFSLNCSWCNKNAANVDALADKYKDNARVQVVDLGIDTSNSYFTRWIQTHKPNHPVVKDQGRAVYNALKTQNGIPQVFVVDCNGTMIDNIVGYWSSTEKSRIDRAIARGLETTCTKAE